MKNTPSSPALPQRLSLVSQTVQSLRHGMNAGYWKEHLPAERELARQLQVGRKTLRAALMELEGEGAFDLSSRQRRRILLPVAKVRAKAQKRTVGILIASPLQTMHARRMFVIQAVQEHLAKAGCATELHVRPRCFSAHPARALTQLQRDHPGVVWIVFGSKEPMQRCFIEQHVPCLIIGTCRPDIGLPSIDVDHRAACHHAGNVLWRKGHRRIALVLPDDAFDGDAASEHGLRTALHDKAGVYLQIIRHDGTKANLCALLDKALRTSTPSTAFLIARAKHALTVAMHLMRRGHALPRGRALISRDEEPFLESTTPTLARYSISLPLYARRIATSARRLAETGTLPAIATRLMPEFIKGETV
jgi:DNA-binding LacI/PurR family transcriptional regulator